MLQQIDACVRRRWSRARSCRTYRVRSRSKRPSGACLLRGMDPTGYYMQAFHAPAATSDDFFPLIILDAVLGGAKGMGLFGGGANNRSNRLYRALVDTELAVGAGSSYHPTVDPSPFFFYATLAPGTSHQAVEDVLWQQIRRIQTKECGAEELEKAIQQTKAQFAYSTESVTHQAYWLGFSEIVASADWLDNWLPALTWVTADDVMRVANQYLQPHKQTVGWYVPGRVETNDAASGHPTTGHARPARHYARRAGQRTGRAGTREPRCPGRRPGRRAARPVPSTRPAQRPGSPASSPAC